MAEKKKKEEKTRKYAYYDVKGDQLARKKRACPKCGAGIFLAEHRDRFACGTCAYTEWKQTQPKP